MDDESTICKDEPISVARGGKGEESAADIDESIDESIERGDNSTKGEVTTADIDECRDKSVERGGEDSTTEEGDELKEEKIEE